MDCVTQNNTDVENVLYVSNYEEEFVVEENNINLITQDIKLYFQSPSNYFKGYVCEKYDKSDI